MPRANRHFLPGYVWHITHRCHKQEFLLKFARDRRRWRQWLHEARKRYGLCVLNYIVTSNHIHLLVRDQGRGEIVSAMQLVAGRTAQQFNRRKGRKGAFWEDRYHATAVETGEHLARCLVYIDLNMVRAGVVGHPRAWEVSGYREIQSPPQRYRVIDRQVLMEMLGIDDPEELSPLHRQWVDAAMQSPQGRDDVWSRSLAVGSEAFVRRIQQELGPRGTARDIEIADGVACIREAPGSYGSFPRGKLTL